MRTELESVLQKTIIHLERALEQQEYAYTETLSVSVKYLAEAINDYSETETRRIRMGEPR